MLFAFQIEKLIKKKFQSESAQIYAHETFCPVSRSTNTRVTGWDGNYTSVESNTNTKHDTERQEKEEDYEEENQFQRFILDSHGRRWRRLESCAVYSKRNLHSKQKNFSEWG